MPITVVSDVEGNWDYFCRYVKLSGALSFADGSDGFGARGALDMHLADGWHFVFGGDAGDKGPGTLRFVQTMVRLKKRYPDRVHLLLGNRDINKMRFTSELADSEIARIEETPPVYWVAGNSRVSPSQYIAKLAVEKAATGDGTCVCTPTESYNTKANRLRWMLEETMGSAGDFEGRREELAIMRCIDREQVSDDDVLESYLQSVAPGGCYYEYLGLAQIGLTLESTLFVHGGLIQCHDNGQLMDTIGHIPGSERVQDVNSWVEALNAWAAAQVVDWKRQPHWVQPPTMPLRSDYQQRGGSPLIQYGHFNPEEPSVILGRHLKENGMPRELPADMVRRLNCDGIRRVVLGHTPHGNCPTVIRQEGMQVIMIDTSYSNMKANDNRGLAVSALIIDGALARVCGQLEDGRRIGYEIDVNGDGDPFVGFVEDAPEENQRFVKAALRASNNESEPGPESLYLLCRHAGFKVMYSDVQLSMLKDLVKEHLKKAVIQSQISKCQTRTRISVAEGSDDQPSLASERSNLEKLDELQIHFMAADAMPRLLDHLYELCDEDRSGNVTLTELEQACDKHAEFAKVLSAVFPDLDLSVALSQLDTDHSGCISIGEFRNNLMSKLMLPLIRTMFRRLEDVEVLEGMIAVGKLHKVFKMIGLPEEGITNLFAEVPDTILKNSCVDYRAFLEWLYE